MVKFGRPGKKSNAVLGGYVCNYNNPYNTGGQYIHTTSVLKIIILKGSRDLNDTCHTNVGISHRAML